MGVVRSCRSPGWRRRGAVFAVVFFAVAIVAAAGRGRLPPAVLHRRRIDSSTLVARSGGATSSAGDGGWRRSLAGPGSSPPTCRARCGRCSPCRAVRVAIQPGIGAQWEYYPEVWRCKCGSKLFMP